MFDWQLQCGGSIDQQDIHVKKTEQCNPKACRTENLLTHTKAKPVHTNKSQYVNLTAASQGQCVPHTYIHMGCCLLYDLYLNSHDSMLFKTNNICAALCKWVKSVSYYICSQQRDIVNGSSSSSLTSVPCQSL